MTWEPASPVDAIRAFSDPKWLYGPTGAWSRRSLLNVYLFLQQTGRKGLSYYVFGIVARSLR